MIESRKFVPEAYSESRDYQVFLKLLDLLIDAIKLDTDTFVNLINPDRCPNHMLPLLASYVGYKYDYNESYDTNRMIIKYFPYLIRNRGSEIGIRLATALSVNSVGNLNDIELLSMFRIEYKRKENKIKIYVYYPRYLSKIRDLLEVVRPAGVLIELIPADLITTIDKVDIYDYLYGVKEKDKIKYQGSDRYKVADDNNVGFGEVETDKTPLDPQ